MATYTCGLCGSERDSWCEPCSAEFPNRPLPDNAEGRAKDLEFLASIPLSVPFGLMHERIEKLVGRPIWTHELGKIEPLLAEIRSGESIGLKEVMEKIPSDKTIIVAEL